MFEMLFRNDFNQETKHTASKQVALI